MAAKKNTRKHLCQKCGKEWPEIYCPTCAILITAEALEARGGILGGKIAPGPPTVELAHLKRAS